MNHRALAAAGSPPWAASRAQWPSGRKSGGRVHAQHSPRHQLNWECLLARQSGGCHRGSPGRHFHDTCAGLSAGHRLPGLVIPKQAGSVTIALPSTAIRSRALRPNAVLRGFTNTAGVARFPHVLPRQG